MDNRLDGVLLERVGPLPGRGWFLGGPFIGTSDPEIPGTADALGICCANKTGKTLVELTLSILSGERSQMEFS